MLTERKLTERELDNREVVLKGLLKNKQNLVKKYGRNAEKVMYGIATKKAKSKVENMNKEKIKELIVKALTHERVAKSVDDVIDPADYIEIGQGYLKGFKRPHSLKDADLETLGRKIVKVLAKGDIEKAKAKFIDEDNDPSGANLEGDPNEYVVGEGHGLVNDDIELLKYMISQLKSGGNLSMDVGARRDMVRLLNNIIKTNIKPGDMGQSDINENVDQEQAVYDLRGIVERVEELGDDARQIVRQYFPNEMSRMDGYGVFDLAYSNNRYDVTLGSEVDRLEGGDYDDLEDEDYPMEEGHMMRGDDLDVGHVDDEPGMLKRELARAGQMVQMLYRAVDKYDGKGEVDFPQWWQAKIIKANAMLDSAFDYLDGEELVAKIDAIRDMVGEEEITKSEENKLKKISKQLKKSVKAHDNQAKTIDKIVKEEDFDKRKEAENAIRQTLKDEGGAAGLKPLVKAVKKFGFNKEELLSLLKKIVKVKKHRHGDYILTPLEERYTKPGLYRKKMKRPSGMVSYMDFTEHIYEKLTKKSDVGDFVDDFKKSDAKQFKGKSDKKKKEMAVAAYLAKQNGK